MYIVSGHSKTIRSFIRLVVQRNHWRRIGTIVHSSTTGGCHVIHERVHHCAAQWPADAVERLLIDETNQCSGRLYRRRSADPLLKFSADTGARAVQHILQDSGFSAGHSNDDAVYDLAIIGAGISGIAAAMEAQKAGLKFVLIESSQAFSTLKNFPKQKPIYTYPTDMVPAGDLRFNGDYKEPLIEDLEARLGPLVSPSPRRIHRIERRGGVLRLQKSPMRSPQTFARSWESSPSVEVELSNSGVPGEDLNKVLSVT